MQTALFDAPTVDRLVGKKELCDRLNWSRPTLDRRIDQDPRFPIERRGSRIGGWGFDPIAVERYLAGEAEVAPAPVSTLQAPQPTHTPAGRAEHAGETTARQLRDQASAEWTLDKLRRARGELVEAADVRETLSTILVRLRSSLTALPDSLVKEFGLSEKVAFAMKARIETAMRGIVIELRNELGAEDRPPNA